MDLLELFLGTPDKQALFIHYILILHSQNDGVFSHLAWNIPETFARANVVRIIRAFQGFKWSVFFPVDLYTYI